MDLRLKEILEEKGITSARFAEMVGIHKVSVSYIINGKQMPSVETLERFAEALGVNFFDLFDNKKEKEQIETDLVCPNCGVKLELKRKE